MTTVYLALGSNIGDARSHIKAAIKLLGASVSDIKEAPLYVTKAVGYTEQPNFTNTVIRGKTDLGPEGLLVFVKEIEKKAGRTWSFRFGPREIDIDIIFYGDTVMETDELTIPHMAFRARDFVLKPLQDLDPKLTDPVSGRTVRQLLDSLAPSVRSIVKQVD